MKAPDFFKSHWVTMNNIAKAYNYSRSTPNLYKSCKTNFKSGKLLKWLILNVSRGPN